MVFEHCEVGISFADIYLWTILKIYSSGLSSAFLFGDYKKQCLSFSLQTNEKKHTIYRKNNNLEKCTGIGLNGFHIKCIIGTQCN